MRTCVECVQFVFKVQPKHVKEAFRLLNKSIIRVETPDIQFDEEDEQQEGAVIAKLNFFCKRFLPISSVCIVGFLCNSGTKSYKPCSQISLDP